MDILVACKIVPDDQDIRQAPDGSLDFSKAHMAISSYDKNAIEAATMMAGDGTVKAIAVGGAKCDDSKTKKDILARGVDELFQVADDTASKLDAFATAVELAALAQAAGPYDVIVVGGGSADIYAQQVGVQLAAKLGLPYASAVVAAEPGEGVVSVKRQMEHEVELVDMPVPCVLAVTPEFAEARVCSMKDILGAGKKPMNRTDPVGGANATEEVSVKAPAPLNRKRQVFATVEEFTAAVKAAL